MEGLRSAIIALIIGSLATIGINYAFHQTSIKVDNVNVGQYHNRIAKALYSLMIGQKPAFVQQINGASGQAIAVNWSDATATSLTGSKALDPSYQPINPIGQVLCVAMELETNGKLRAAIISNPIPKVLDLDGDDIARHGGGAFIRSDQPTIAVGNGGSQILPATEFAASGCPAAVGSIVTIVTEDDGPPADIYVMRVPSPDPAAARMTRPFDVNSQPIQNASEIDAPAQVPFTSVQNNPVSVHGSETVQYDHLALNYWVPDASYVASEVCGARNNGKTRWNPTLYGNLGGMERCVGGAATWRPFSEYQWGAWSACISDSQSRQCIKLGQNVPVSDARYCGGATASDFTQACISCDPATGQSCVLSEIIDGVNVVALNDGVHNFCADEVDGYNDGTPSYNGFWSVCTWQGSVQCNGSCVPGGCPNGGLNYPTCNICFAGYYFDGTNCVAPTCASNTGAQCAADTGAGIGYIACGGQCQCPNGTSYQIINGAAECFPNNQCADGATNPPACDNNANCNNGATNPPSCNSCPNGQVYSNSQCVTLCSNGATDPPACNNNAPPPTCSNGATNYPACNNNAPPPSCTNGATNYPACDNNAPPPPSCTPNWVVSVPGGGPLYRGYLSVADAPNSCGSELYMTDFNAGNGARAITAAQAIAQGMLPSSWCDNEGVQYQYCWDATCADNGVFVINGCAASGPFATRYTVAYQVNWDIQSDGCGNTRYGPSFSGVSNTGGDQPNCCYSSNPLLTPPDPACH